MSGRQSIAQEQQRQAALRADNAAVLEKNLHRLAKQHSAEVSGCTSVLFFGSVRILYDDARVVVLKCHRAFEQNPPFIPTLRCPH